ncbi:MAG: alpha/beta hydrolase [Gammaproteobacteria bacterium]|nr:alpha/beta hydrolase [Gammaproteobacteria bacterium]
MKVLRSPEAVRANKLDPMAQKVADAAARLPQIEDGSPEDARAMRRERGNPFAPDPAELENIEDIEIPIQSGSLMLRIYRPFGWKQKLGSALIFYHGGGFVLGDVEQYDTVVQHLAAKSGCIAISVEYQLAPENKIKGIHQDGFDAYCWIRENAADLGIDKNRIAIGGDSAGGNLTIGVELLCKQANYPVPKYQVLIYPSVDLPMSFPSVEEFGEGYFLTSKGMTWFRSHYLESPVQANDPDLLFLERDVSGLSPAFVVTAGFDPLRDEGKAFADHLEQQGVPAEHVCYTDMIHGFISFAGGIGAGMELIEAIASRLKTEL